MRLPKRTAALAASVGMLGSCSSLVHNHMQTIDVFSDPAGARCALMRGGVEISVVNATPGRATVTRSGVDIVVVCSKPGYALASGIAKADIAAASLLLGSLGWAVDDATGTSNAYDRAVRVTLKPDGTHG